MDNTDEEEAPMDMVFACAGALMFAAIVGMVIGCDKLGVRK